MFYFGQSSGYGDALEVLNFMFAGIFTVEAILRVTGVGFWEYVTDPWSLFDFLIVVGTDLGIVLRFVVGLDVGTIATLIRTFRIARIVRLIRSARSLRVLLSTLIATLPSLANIGSLLFLLLLVYAIMGV